MKQLFLGIVIILVLGLVAFVFSLTRELQEEPQVQEQEETSPMQTMNLKIEDIVTGEGAEAVQGKTAVMHYTGTLLDGTKFDSSLDRGTPFSFVLGANQVIAGWDQGVSGMKVGGKRMLTVPPDLAYGSQGIPGVIPPDSTLVFELELLDVLEP